MIFATKFYGIKSVANNIPGILNKFIKNGNNDNIVDVKNFKIKQDNKYDNNLNISNRIIINNSILNIDYNYKAEYLPFQYNFK